MQKQLAKLYVIATPLGHRDDMTLRALNVVRDLKHIFAEDTREFKKLLNLHGVSLTHLAIHSYAQHNLASANEKALKFLLEGQSIGLVCDRGTPGVSDPGAELVRSAMTQGFEVVPVPGASSVTALISVSGMTQFCFVGFLPTKEKERAELWDRVGGAGYPLLFFESPKRIRKTVQQIKERFPDGRLFVGREMTKVFEEYRWETLSELNPENLSEQGEYSLLLDFGSPSSNVGTNFLDEAIRLRLMSEKQWSKSLAQASGLTAKEIYNALQQKKRDDSDA